MSLRIKGCNFNEIFNPSIKDPLSNFRIIGTNGIQKVIILNYHAKIILNYFSNQLIYKILDKDLKETIFQLEGTSTKLSIPKETKTGRKLIFF